MKICSTLLLATLAGMAASAQTLYPGNIPGCIARYDFNTTTAGAITTLADVSGNGNNSASVTNLTTTADFRGAGNKAILFNGFSSSVFVPDAPLLNPDTQLTMIALVRADGFYSGTCQLSEILSKGTVTGSAGNYYMGISDNRADGDDCFAYNPAKMQMDDGWGQQLYLQPAGHFLSTGKWYFMASTYNGSEKNSYVVEMNPQQKQESISPYHTAPLSGNMGVKNEPLTIGYHDASTHPYWFSGAMDEVALFNRGLTNTEVYTIYSYLWGATLSVGNTEQLNSISTYPNPAQNVLNISGSLNSRSAQLEVYNAMGRKVQSAQVQTVNGMLQHTLDISNLPAGNYILRLNAEGNSQTTKFSVQR